MNNFVSLHVHSTYSFVDGYGTPKQYFDTVQKLEQPALACTDHGNISSHFKWYKEGKKRAIKPILGCEMYVVEDEKDVRKRDYNHITIIAKNSDGYQNLIKLVTKSWLERFYYKPRITYKDLEEHKEGLIILSGCLNSPFLDPIKNGNEQLAKERLKHFRTVFTDFYAEVQPITFEQGIEPYKRFIKLVKKMKIPMVATMDCHYPEAHQAKIQEIFLCVQSNDSMKRPAPPRWKFDQDDFYLKTREQMEQSFKVAFPETDFTEALDNTIKIADSINFEFPIAHPLKFPIPDQEKEKRLKEMVWKGMKEKGLDKNKEYINRAKYEIDLIIKKDFVDYFLVIADLINYAKRSGILVGPARGSAAGSLVCFLTRITEVDPIIHGLIFERFIDINREDLPDIDIDFEDEKRHIVKKYLAEKYGQDQVGDIATFGTFKGKMCISDLGRVFKIPYEVTEKVKSLLIQRSGGDSRASFTVMDTFDQFEYPKEMLKQYPELAYASQMEGQIRQLSKHAAGVVVSNEPLTNFCAIYQRDGERVISMDYYDASSAGLLKIDILGLSTLTYLKKAADLVAQRHNKLIDFYNIPLDDPKVYEMFNDPERLFGVFQFDGQAVNQVCRQIKPKNFSELSDITALARPGPLNSGSATGYIMRKVGKEPVTYVHPYMEKITSDTQGMVIYQEQVMRTMREVGNMSWKDTAEIRKNISRSRGVEAFNEFRAKFEIGAKDNGLTQKEIDAIWNVVCTHGSWSFNKSHSVSYTYISYWTMWMKVYYPLEYYTAIMSTITKEETIRKVIKEFRREGYKVYPVDVNKSKETFSIDDAGIRLGFLQVKGIGEKTAKTIVENQPYRNYQDFLRKLQGKRITKKVINLLERVGAFQSVGGILEEETNLFNREEKYKNWIEPTFEELIEICPYSIDFNLESKWSDFMKKYLIRYPEKIADLAKEDNFTGSPWDKPDRYIMGIAYDKNPRDKREVSMSKGLHTTFKEGESTEFCNMIVEDDSDFITVRLGTRTFPQYKKMIFEDITDSDILVIRGKMGAGIRMFFANSIVVLRILKEKIEKNIPMSVEEKSFVKSSINKFIHI